MSELGRLVRAPNLALAAGGVVAGGWIALETLALPTALCWAAASAIALGAVGNIVNDLFDVPADIANQRTTRPLVAHSISPRQAVAAACVAAPVGLGAAALAGRAVLGAAAVALVVLLIYSPVLKPVPLLGNVAVALVAGFPLAYGALAVSRFGAGLVPWALAGALHFVRELVKDVEDAPGDRLAGRRTVAVVLGVRRTAVVASAAALAFVPLSVVLPLRAHYGAAYYLIALPAQMAVLVAATQLLLGEIARAPRLLKAAMVAGLVALVSGRVT